MTTRPTLQNRREVVNLPNLSWGIDFSPRRAKINVAPGFIRNPQDADWQQEILPGRNFSIIYPFARYEEINPTIPYEAEGQPVTLLDLLSTIYDFYQEPIPQNELNILIQEDPEIYSDAVKRLDAMFSLTFFEGLESVGNDVYRLKLGS